MRHLGFKSSLADPDVWIREAVTAEGAEYWEYILLYTDDVLVILDTGEKKLRDGIGKYFQLKEESTGKPKIYLGGHMQKVTLENGQDSWAFGSSQYWKAAVANVETFLAESGAKLPSRAETSIQTSYRPELDILAELKPTEAAYFQSLIVILWWLVELGSIDICLECSMLSSHLVLPQEGHLKQVYHMFAYLKKIS